MTDNRSPHTMVRNVRIQACVQIPYKSMHALCNYDLVHYKYIIIICNKIITYVSMYCYVNVVNIVVFMMI